MKPSPSPPSAARDDEREWRSCNFFHGYEVTCVLNFNNVVLLSFDDSKRGKNFYRCCGGWRLHIFASTHRTLVGVRVIVFNFKGTVFEIVIRNGSENLLCEKGASLVFKNEKKLKLKFNFSEFICLERTCDSTSVFWKQNKTTHSLTPTIFAKKHSLL